LIFLIVVFAQGQQHLSNPFCFWEVFFQKFVERDWLVYLVAKMISAEVKLVLLDGFLLMLLHKTKILKF